MRRLHARRAAGRGRAAAHASRSPTEAEVMDALGGVLCRCTGYRKIVDGGARRASLRRRVVAAPAEARSAGGLPRLDGARKLSGAEIYGADEWPADALTARAVRSPHHHARLRVRRSRRLRARPSRRRRGFHRARRARRKSLWRDPGLRRPAGAGGRRSALSRRGGGAGRRRGGGDAALDLAGIPVVLDASPRADDDRRGAGGGRAAPPRRIAPAIFSRAAGSRAAMPRRRWRRPTSSSKARSRPASSSTPISSPRRVSRAASASASRCRPARRRPTWTATTSPKILGIAPDAVRIMPTAVGGGFGSKLDLSVQPFIALAAWRLNRPVRMVYTRPESIMTTTKRHPARIRAQSRRDARRAADGDGFRGRFQHRRLCVVGADGRQSRAGSRLRPLSMPHYRATRARSIRISFPPAPFAASACRKARSRRSNCSTNWRSKLGIDPLEFRILNALEAGEPTVTGQVFADGVGFKACLEALRPRWRAARAAARGVQRAARGPAAARRRRRRHVVRLRQHFAVESLDDAPRTEARRPGGAVSGRGRYRAGLEHRRSRRSAPTRSARRSRCRSVSARHRHDAGLRQDLGLAPDLCHRQRRAVWRRERCARQILRLANAGEDATLELRARRDRRRRGRRAARSILTRLPVNAAGFVVEVAETFDPPTTPLDADGQGEPYAVFGSGAHLAEIEVDIELGRVRVLRLVCAHDVGRAINPTLVEGQIEGGAAQGLGLALMEEFIPGTRREPARLSDPDHRRHAAGRMHPDRGPVVRSARSAPRASASRR